MKYSTPADSRTKHYNGLKNGYCIHWSCAPVENNVDNIVGIIGSNTQPPKTCYASWIILVERNSLIPLCMMSKYDDLAFIECLNIDFDHWNLTPEMEWYFTSNQRWRDEERQTKCVRDALYDCFKQYGIINEFGENDDVIDTSLSYLSQKQRILNVQNSGFNNILNDKNHNQLLDVNSSISTNSLLYDHPFKAKNMPYSIFVSEPPWVKPSPFSYLGQLISNIRLSKNEIRDSMIQMKCNITTMSALRNKNSENNNDVVGSCYHYHHYNSDTLSEYHQANLSCGPTFIIAGFMKAGSTFLFNSLSSHPQILRNLKGVAFKEAAAYLDIWYTNTPSLRMNRFPFIEEYESSNFIFGDGTITYGVKQQIPYYLKRDNEKLKVLFVVRDPIERSKSHHRYFYAGFKTDIGRNLNLIVSNNLFTYPSSLLNMYNLAREALKYQNGSVDRIRYLEEMVRFGLSKFCLILFLLLSIIKKVSYFISIFMTPSG